MTAPRWGRCSTRSPEPSRRSPPTAPSTRALCPRRLRGAIQTRPSWCRHDPPPCRATPPQPIRRNATATYKVSPTLAAPVGRNPPATTSDHGSRLRSAGSSRSLATVCIPRPTPARMPRSPSPSTYSTGCWNLDARPPSASGEAQQEVGPSRLPATSVQHGRVRRHERRAVARSTLNARRRYRGAAHPNAARMPSSSGSSPCGNSRVT